MILSHLDARGKVFNSFQDLLFGGFSRNTIFASCEAPFLVRTKFVFCDFGVIFQPYIFCKIGAK